jgi:hypothetical protein
METFSRGCLTGDVPDEEAEELGMLDLQVQYIADSC